MVSVSEKSEINKTVSELKQEYLYFLLFSGLVVLIIIFLIFIAIFRGLDSKVRGEKK